MNASCQKMLPLNSLGINVQAFDRLNESSQQILISEKQYLGLKADAGYWQAMHAKALVREKKTPAKNQGAERPNLRSEASYIWYIREK